MDDAMNVNECREYSIVWLYLLIAFASTSKAEKDWFDHRGRYLKFTTIVWTFFSSKRLNLFIESAFLR